MAKTSANTRMDLDHYPMGDFDGSSDDDDQIAMVQLLMASQYCKMQRRHNQQGGHVGSTSGQAFSPRDRVAANERTVIELPPVKPTVPEVRMINSASFTPPKD